MKSFYKRGYKFLFEKEWLMKLWNNSESIKEKLMIKEKFKVISLTLEPEIYSKLKKNIQKGELSKFANSLFRDYFNNEKKKKSTSDYINSQKSKNIREIANDLENSFDYENDDRW